MKQGDVILSRYTVQCYLGSGGMQDVFLAHDSLLDIDVAIKTPQPGQQDKRFSKSAKVAARVNHHNVAKTLDYFDFEGSLYLVEEYVPGETLDKKLDQFGVVDPHLAARVFHHLAKGIAASHHAGVIHRDLKPSNIIAEPGVNLHRLKITDFGIATLTEEVFEQAANAGDLTRSTSGTIKGALPYMAPEVMFRTSSDVLTGAVDIWSLGAMMFKLLSSEYPFGVYLDAAVNVKNRSRAKWPAFMTQNLQFKPLSVELQKIVEKCLEYEAEKRPTADDLICELAELCYLNTDRVEGVVENFIQNNCSGFAKGDDGVAFFSMESVYGKKKPIINGRISYSIFPGSPRFRGHPVVVVE